MAQSPRASGIEDKKMLALETYSSIYKLLPLGPSQIRVLLLHSSSSFSAAIECTLRVIELKPKPSASYIGLSYVWGDTSITENIIVNGVSLAITTNLVSALRHIRHALRDTTFWADAICTYLFV
jgi:hypothetical protein